MERFFAILSLFIFGAAFGSFACCQVWRIRKNDKSKWSHCMNCKYQLQWYDNIPIISWLALGGKCRKCRKKIGYAEILAEVGVALLFAFSFVFWPAQDQLLLLNISEIIKFVLFLALIVIDTILFIYDAKWREMPTKLLIGACTVAAVFCGVSVWQSYNLHGDYNWLSFVLGLLFLPGIYYLLYKISKETWVGGGDWILCLSIAFVLGNMWLSLFCLFISNMIGCIVMLPIVKSKKKKRVMIPFGPFLIAGFLLVFFLQDIIINFMGF